MDTQIYNHDNDLDIVHKINELELLNWINHLGYVSTELHNIIAFYNVQRDNGIGSKDNLVKKFENLLIDTNVILNSLSKYNNNRINVAECDNMACDMTFITEHETYRHMYRYHIEKYRKQKNRFYLEIKGKVIQ